ncbi:MAG: pyridoxamine 5'-phosphate oxidase family protein [Candidatus Pacebacteria bacterium]|nr:pyridoxamine 5'-phosphate oxidase family protein [Candidatus Paceibacterota bacterium]
MQSIEKELVNFLKKNTTAVIATTHQRLPYLSTIYYVIDDKLSFFFITTKSTDKYLNLLKNDNVAMVIGSGPKHISAQLRGHAHIVYGKQKENATKAIFALHKKNKLKVVPIKDLKRLQSKNKPEEFIVFKVIPQQLNFMNLDDHDYPKSLSRDYHYILPRRA